MPPLAALFLHASNISVQAICTDKYFFCSQIRSIKSTLGCTEEDKNSPQIGVPVEWAAVYHCCGSVDVGADAGVGVDDDADDFHNA